MKNEINNTPTLRCPPPINAHVVKVEWKGYFIPRFDLFDEENETVTIHPPRME